MRRVLLLAGLLGAVSAITAGCGGGGKQVASRITPRMVERTFSRQGIQLVNTMLYADGDRPIIRSYDVPGQGITLAGSVFVYDSSQDAASAETRYRKVYGKRGIASGNVIAQFTRDTTESARRQITRAMASLP